ncbi:MAG: hypothetical protein QW423_00050 [Candidatus Aenigmatarchaeota archaeon]
MHNLLKSNKAQFFLLSAFAIITTIFYVSQWIEPYTITDTSSVAIREDFFIFNNIVEKAKETVALSKDCEDLKFNLEEYKLFVKNFALYKTSDLIFDYKIVSCDSFGASVSFNITLMSPSSYIKRSFVENKLFQ